MRIGYVSHESVAIAFFLCGYKAKWVRDHTGGYTRDRYVWLIKEKRLHNNASELTKSDIHKIQTHFGVEEEHRVPYDPLVSEALIPKTPGCKKFMDFCLKNAAQRPYPRSFIGDHLYDADFPWGLTMRGQYKYLKDQDACDECLIDLVDSWAESRYHKPQRSTGSPNL